MNDAWTAAMKQRLRQAAQNPPGAEVLRPRAEQSVRRAVQAAAARGRAPRVQVRASRDRLTVQAQGPAADAVLRDVRRDLGRQRRDIVEDLRAEGRRRLRGR